MTGGFEIRCYEYVNRPYAVVKSAFHGDVREIFRDATKGAAARARSLASELRINIAGLELGADISVDVKEINEQPGAAGSPPTTRIELAWEAIHLSNFFPRMTAELALYPLTSTETQLDFSGRYNPPLGALGDAINMALGHRVAEACVHSFLRDVAAYLRATLPEKA